MPRVFITLAEVSADQHAAHLICALRAIDPAIRVEGLGGPRMREAGAIVHHETTERAAMTWHGAKRALEVWRLLRWTKQRYAGDPPDLHICIDSPAMNFHFAKAAKQRGVPVLYYVAPQVWAWREGRVKKLRRRVDHLACILPFEEEYFRRHGVPATFVGHPLFDERRAGTAEPARMVGDAHPTAGLLAGSRKSEAEANLPPLLEVARQIRAEFPQARFLLPTTPATHPVVMSMIESAGIDRTIFTAEQDRFDEVVPRCDLCLVVSGTATLHVAVHDVPMIVVYRASPILWHLGGRWLVKTRTFALVNLLTTEHRHLVPEFVPWLGPVDPVATMAIDMLKHPEKLEAQRRALRCLVEKLNRPGAAERTAELAVKLMRKE